MRTVVFAIFVVRQFLVKMVSRIKIIPQEQYLMKMYLLLHHQRQKTKYLNKKFIQGLCINARIVVQH